ncbi:hypothetical protein BOQ63_002325 (plasmid) [Streptomyces viridifaciens]|nr:hypothetical protein BOQ63_002325 [Streptomyces viridifaciens]
MDPELIGLASAAATALVGRLAADGWEQAKRAVVALWRRSGRANEAEVVAGELEECRSELLASGQSEEGQAAAREMAIEWRGRLRGLLAAEPALAEELRALLTELRPDQPESGARVEMHGTASDQANIYMSGGSMHISGS